MKTEIISDPDAFVELREWWNSQPGPMVSPFLRAEWFHAMAVTLLEPDDSLRLILVQDGADPVGALPMFRRGRRLRSLTELSTERFDLIHEPNPEVIHRVIGELTRHPYVRFEALGAGSPLVKSLEAQQRWVVDHETESADIYLTSSDQVMANLSRNLRKNLRRGLRALEDMGKIEIVPVTPPDLVPMTLSRALDLEAAGWKGQAGVAAKQSPARRRFFTRLSEEAEWLRLGAMYLDDRMIAFNFDLESRGRIVSLLTSYDEDLPRRCSPGHVLLWKTLEAASARGVGSYCLGGIGGQNSWKRQWSKDTTSRCYITGFGSGLAGGLALSAWRARRAVRTLGH